MFKISQTETFFWTVEVKIPVSPGKFEKQTFDAEFKRISQSRFKEIMSEINSEDNPLTDAKLCSEVVVGWRGVTDDKGEEIQFSVSAFNELLDVPLVANAIVAAFFESRSGGKTKN